MLGVRSRLRFSSQFMAESPTINIEREVGNPGSSHDAVDVPTDNVGGKEQV